MFKISDTKDFKDTIATFKAAPKGDQAELKKECRTSMEENRAQRHEYIAAHRAMLEALGEDWQDEANNTRENRARGCVLELAEQAVKLATRPNAAYTQFEADGDLDKLFATPAGREYFYAAPLEEMDRLDGTTDWSLS